MILKLERFILGERKFANPLSWGRGEGNDSAIADRASLIRNDGKQQTEKNLFTYLPIHLFTSKKVAFTLAEVLITLGIIGVVAAMTMPTLISNHKKQVWVNQLKKSVSTLEQGFQKMLADDEVSSLEDTEVFKSINSSLCSVYEDMNSPSCGNFFKKLKTYFNIIDITSIDDYKTGYLNSKNEKSYYDKMVMTFADSSMLLEYDFFKTEDTYMSCDVIKANGGNMCAEMGYVMIDVNGKKGPNIYGRDIFGFWISADGHLIPVASKSLSVFDNSPSDYWRNDISKCGTPGVADAEEKSEGFGCAARIIENGWVMDY